MPCKDSDQPGHLHNLRIVHEQALGTKLSREDLLVLADVQAELSSQLAHTPNCKLCPALAIKPLMRQSQQKSSAFLVC